MFSLCTIAKSYTSDEVRAKREAIVAQAKQYIGCDYQSGAIGPSKFDCSGLVYTVFHDAAEIQMPRTVKAIYSVSKIVEKSQAEPGDLIFFKTAGSDVMNHVGIYIGKNQFIHAASDGSNTGVIVSSLRERYYANAYAATGKILPSLDEPENIGNESESEAIPVSGSSPISRKSSYTSNNFLSKLEFDAGIYCDWNFLLPDQFILNWRGILIETACRYTGWEVQPGLGVNIRYNYGTSNWQIPITFNMSFGDYVKVYAGPVIHCGDPRLPLQGDFIRGSVFPGILGVTFSTPRLHAGKVDLALAQDISYTVYNNKDGSALGLGDNFATGFVFSTGVRVTLPMSRFL